MDQYQKILLRNNGINSELRRRTHVVMHTHAYTHTCAQPANLLLCGPLWTTSQQLISTIRKASLSPNYQCVISALMKCLQEATLSACIVGIG